jgi:sugar lactone lactonase YvrE
MKTSKLLPDPVKILALLLGSCLSILAAGKAHAQTADLFASVNHPDPTGRGAVFEYTPTGVQSTFLTNVNQPRGVAFDCDGNFFVTAGGIDDNGNQVEGIFKRTPGGVISLINLPNGYLPEDIAVDSMGNLFVMANNLSDPNLASTIFKVSPGGGISIFGGAPGQGFGLAFDSMGNLFAADASDQTIFVFTPTGKRSVFVGPSAFTSVQGPIGLAFDSAGNLFVSTEGNSGNPGGDAILEFTPAGMEMTFATGLTNNPRGLAFDSAGNLFVAETGIGRSGDILKFTPGGVETVFATAGRPQGNGGPEFLAFQSEPCQFPSAIAANFNGTKINSGSTIWFSSVLSPSGLGASPVTFTFTNQRITSANFTVVVPDAQVTFDPAATSATTTFTGGMWVTRVPSKGLAGNTFFSGASFQVPANIPGGVKNVTWSGTITSDTPTASLHWQWAAAVYTSFGADYNSDGIKPVDDNKASAYQNSDHAGTPESFKSKVIGGATGGGGSNFTGSLSGTVTVGPCCSR